MVSQKICPKCRSKDITTDWSDTMLGKPTLSKYKCNKCGYESRIFPEVG
ncbi:hypothetical protein HYX08_05045 [Candidatus Woesearchaeota archaeon]|nr:hypothetical protein [Candidatus Woesearchaeota archaeon]